MSAPQTPVTPYLEPAGEAPGGAQARAAVAVLLALLAVVGGLVADAVAGMPPAEPAAEPVEQGPASAGVWYCPAVAAEEESAIVSIAAVGDEPTTATLVRYPEARPRPDEPIEVQPGTATEVVLAAGEADTPVAVRWEGGPATVAWRKSGRDVAGGMCAAAPSEQWHVAGLSTAGGARSSLHLFNPFTVDAVVRVVFGTAEGRVALVLTDNLVVEAGTTRAVDLGEYQPEEADLAATVEVLSGRVVAAGELVLAPSGQQTGPTGRTLVPAAPATDDEWAFGYAEAAEDVTTSVVVYNPSDREAAVDLQVTDPSPDGPALAEQSVPAGGLITIDLTDAAETPAFAVAVRSVTDVPVVVARVTAYSGDAEGVAASLGATPSRHSAIASAGAQDRVGALSLFNPGGETVEVAVDAGDGTPAEWAAIEVPANGRAVLDLSLAGDAPAIPLVITASGPVVAEGRFTGTGEALQVWTVPAVPAAAWEGPALRPPARRDRGVTTSPLPPTEAPEDPAEPDETSPFEPRDGGSPAPEPPGEPSDGDGTPAPDADEAPGEVPEVDGEQIDGATDTA